MFIPQLKISSQFVLIVFVVVLTVLGSAVYAQAPQPQDEVSNGIKLYQEGLNKDAISALRAALVQNQKDAEAWHYLGLAFNRDQNYSMALEALRKSVKLRPNYAAAHSSLAHVLLLTGKNKEAEKEVSKAIRYDPHDTRAKYVSTLIDLYKGNYQSVSEKAEFLLQFYPTYDLAPSLKAQALISLFSNSISPGKLPTRSQLMAITQTLEGLISKYPDAPKMEECKLAIERLKAFAEYLDKLKSNKIPLEDFKDGVTKPKITYKERAKYTEEARDKCVEGAVLLLAIFAANGKIAAVFPVKGLPHGLTQTAMEAAQKIKFEPAMKDGKTVTVAMMLEFNFDLY